MKQSRVDRERFRAAYENGATYAELASQFDITERYARVLRDRMGLDVRNGSLIAKREVPEDFAQIVADVGISKARAHYGASWGTVARWCDEAGIERTRHAYPAKRQSGRQIELPEGWHDLAPNMFMCELRRHYGFSHTKIRRLVALSGVKTKMTVHEKARLFGKKERKKAAKPRAARGHFRLASLATPVGTNDNVDIYGAAASHLRRTFSNVFRCDIKLYVNRSTTYGDERGLPNRGRDHYYVAGLGVITKENMISIAEQKGFVTHDHAVGAA